MNFETKECLSAQWWSRSCTNRNHDLVHALGRDADCTETSYSKQENQISQICTETSYSKQENQISQAICTRLTSN
jgi:hypothetical protein